MTGERDPLPEGGPAKTTPDGGERGGLTRAMRAVLWCVGLLVLVGLAIALRLSTADGEAGAPPAADGTAAQTPDATPTRGPLPDATPVTGSEVPEPDATAPPADRLPPLSAPAPLVSAPLPGSGTASGQLVDGFPENAMAPAPASAVLLSSIATEGDTMQVTLRARTDATPEEVSRHYRVLWSGLGLADVGASGAAGASYGDGLSSLSLAFSASAGTGTVYTVYGVFRTK